MAKPTPVKKLNGWLKIIMTVIAVIGLTTGLVVWAADETASAKEWAAQQDLIQEKRIEKYYVPKSDFSRLETEIRQSREDIEDMQEDVEDIQEKVNKIYDTWMAMAREARKVKKKRRNVR